MAKVLLVDDDPDLLEQAVDALQIYGAGFTLLTAHDGEKALTMIEKDPPDVVISDIAMPVMDGLTLCRKIKLNIFLCRIPVILLTARAQIDDRLSGFEAGADDYLVKPIDYRELAARIRALVRRYKVIMDLNPSTRLPGADAVEEELQQRIRRKEKFAICYLDLDNFKAYADTYGFEYANKAIKTTARIISETLREMATKDTFLAHIGGDDFIVLCPTRSARTICREVLEQFEKKIITCFKEDDINNGYFLGYDRDGNYRKFPIMSISIVILSNSDQPFQGAREIGELASKAKRMAKKLPGSNIMGPLKKTDILET